MKTQSIDTHPEVEKIQISLLRKESTAQKFSRVRSLSNTALQLSRRAVARANKNLNEKQINLLFIHYQYGEEVASRVEKYLNDNGLW